MDDTTTFFRDAFGDVDADEYYTLVWSAPDKVSRFHHGWRDAASDAKERAADRDVYVGVGLHTRDLGAHQRGKRADIAGIVGLWADIDVADAVHKKGNLPPSASDALALLEAMPLRATTLIDSGHGFQAWWLFQEPYIFDADDRDRERTQAIVAGWNDLLKSHGTARGWDVDSTWDLTRVMRVPGTHNRKRPEAVKPVRTLWRDGPRYAGPSDFVDYITLTPRPSFSANGYDAAATPVITVNEQADVPYGKLEALLTNEPKFKGSWERRRKDLQDQSASGYCQSLASLAAIAGWTDQEIADLLAMWRRRQQEPSKPPEWYARTIATARRGREQNEALNRLVNGDAEQDDRESVIAALREALNVPIAGWVQCGQDKAVYSLRLDDGTEIGIGPATAVLAPQQFRAALYRHGYVLPTIKPDRWHEIARILTTIVEVTDSGESTRAARLNEWIASYLNGTPPRGVDDWEKGLLDNLPFERDGVFYIHAGSLRRYALFTLIERVEHGDVIDMLRAAGFRRDQVSGRVEGVIVTRSYWGLQTGQMRKNKNEVEEGNYAIT